MVLQLIFQELTQIPIQIALLGTESIITSLSQGVKYNNTFKNWPGTLHISHIRAQALKEKRKTEETC